MRTDEDGEVLDDAFLEWIRQLDEDVIQGEYGYEEGEFTVYTSHWRELYDKGCSPAEAFKRALDGYANARDEAEDEAGVARSRNPSPPLR